MPKTSWQNTIGGVPIVDDLETRYLVGILTNRDLRFISDYSILIDEVMTKENLVTAPVGTHWKTQAILQKHKIEKLPLVDDKGCLAGLITIKDIEKVIEFPNSVKTNTDVYSWLQRWGLLQTHSNVQKPFRLGRRGRTSSIQLMDKWRNPQIKEIRATFPDATLIAGNAKGKEHVPSE